LIKIYTKKKDTFQKLFVFFCITISEAPWTLGYRDVAFQNWSTNWHKHNKWNERCFGTLCIKLTKRYFN